MRPPAHLAPAPLGALALALLLGACAAEQPKVVVPPPPPPPLVAPPKPAPVDWADLPVTAGTWRYTSDASGSAARFGAAGEIRLACLKATRQIALTRAGATGALTVRTTYGSRSLAAPGGTATVAASDPLLDQIAFSRGRFSVEATGVALVMMPVWAEPARVIEDCRG